MPSAVSLTSKAPRLLEVFLVFLKLGLTSFGGPIAHLGYYHEEFVKRRQWLSEESFADLIALCQFLPGPASSQIGFSIGVLRGQGLAGGIVAWSAFTLPSALLMLAFALSATLLAGASLDGLVHGLKLVAVAVVAHAVRGLAATLAPDRPRAAIALAAVALVLLVGGALSQVVTIGLGALVGWRLCRAPAQETQGQLRMPVARPQALAALLLFALLLLGLPLLVKAGAGQGVALFDAFYRSGALVFGGGHVVLPLLQAEVVTPGWLNKEDFLAGYGFAQALPGPLFALAAYLGAAAGPSPNGLIGGTLALVAIFLPGLLLVYGMLPFWDGLRKRPDAQAAMRGANAAVVGILGAALYDPVWTSAIGSPSDFVAALAGFMMLSVWKVAPWVVVVVLTGWGFVLAM